jgi:hypothetical protein
MCAEGLKHHKVCNCLLKNKSSGHLGQQPHGHGFAQIKRSVKFACGYAQLILMWDGLGQS